MRVTQKLQVFNLALDAADHVAADELLPGDNLEGDLLAGADVSSQSDLTKRAFPQGPNNLVRAYALLGLCLLLGRRADRLRGRAGAAVLLLIPAVTVVVMMAGLGILLLLLPTDVRRRERNGQLLIVEASRAHGQCRAEAPSLWVFGGRCSPEGIDDGGRALFVRCLVGRRLGEFRLGQDGGASGGRVGTLGMSVAQLVDAGWSAGGAGQRQSGELSVVRGTNTGQLYWCILHVEC